MIRIPDGGAKLVILRLCQGFRWRSPLILMKNCNKKIWGAVRDNPPDDTAKIPDGAVALTQSEDLKFHRVINNESWYILIPIHINTGSMTLTGIMTLCKHRLTITTATSRSVKFFDGFPYTSFCLNCWMTHHRVHCLNKTMFIQQPWPQFHAQLIKTPGQWAPKMWN